MSNTDDHWMMTDNMKCFNSVVGFSMDACSLGFQFAGRNLVDHKLIRFRLRITYKGRKLVEKAFIFQENRIMKKKLFGLLRLIIELPHLINEMFVKSCCCLNY